MRFKEKYARKKLIQLVARQPKVTVIPKLDQRSVVGVIWQPSEKPALQILRNHFGKQGVIFRDFCIFDKTTNPAHEKNSLSSKDLSWWGIPKPEKTNEFIDIKFDVLFCLATEHNFPIEYMVALSKAKFKVGGSEYDDNYFDLNIKVEKNKDTNYLAKQQIYYLSQLINTTTK